MTLVSGPTLQLWLVAAHPLTNSPPIPGYTYPDIVATVNGQERRVKLSDPLPETDQEVHEIRNVIQTHFGVNKKVPVLGPQLKMTYDDGSVPAGHRVVPSYHRFYTFVELVGHAFGGSYSLEVLYKKKVIGSFAVLTRGDATQCASCKVRRKAGGEVRGIVDIPDETLQDIVESESEALATADDLVEALSKLIKTKLTVRLVDAAGNLLADTVARGGVPGIGPSGNNEGRRLEAAITPRVRLQSAGAVRKRDETLESTHDGKPSETDITFFNHADHGDLLEGPVAWLPY